MWEMEEGKGNQRLGDRARSEMKRLKADQEDLA